MTDYIRPELFRVSEILESWAEDQLPPPSKGLGICVNLALVPEISTSGMSDWEALVMPDWEALVAEAAKTWPEFSGDLCFPVPHPDLLPESAYTAKWEVEKWSGEYGESRRRLCQHVADWIRKNPLRAEQILHWG